jgi:hypothetical protein
MEQHEPLDVRVERELDGLLVGRMSPADERSVLARVYIVSCTRTLAPRTNSTSFSRQPGASS